MTCKELYEVLEKEELMEYNPDDEYLKVKISLDALNKIREVLDKVIEFNEPSNIPEDDYLMTTEDIINSLKGRENDIIDNSYVWITTRELFKVRHVLKHIISIDTVEIEHEVTEKSPYNNLDDSWYCPVCGDLVVIESNYCPHCRSILRWSILWEE